MRVTDGVFRVDRVEGNAYVVVTDDGLLQVDSGLPGNARRICRFIEEMGHDPGEVHDIVLTHYDGDHVGSAAALKARTGARVCIHEADAPVLTREQKPGERMPLFVRILYRLLMKPLTPDRLLHDGDMVGGLRVMHIPGHTPGSIALVRDDGVVFSGDALLCDKHGNVIHPILGWRMTLTRRHAPQRRSRHCTRDCSSPGTARQQLRVTMPPPPTHR
jgi:glyoxylase-like metal-dependent hydrolase (beta-lactamase superfamily II)